MSNAAVRYIEPVNEAAEEVLALVAHELRGPLSAIVGWTQLLQQGDLGGDQRARGLEIILRNAKAQERLIGDLFDAARISRGRLSLRLAPFDLAEQAESM